MISDKSEILANPFAVKTPENLSAEEIVELFVPYPEFNNLQVSGHQFLNGHRGSGKSMMLKMMAPDSQQLYRKCDFYSLPYFGIYFSIKATELNAPEFTRLEKEPSGTVLSEHVLTTKLLSALFISLKKHCHFSAEEFSAFREVITSSLFQNLKYTGWTENLPSASDPDLELQGTCISFVIKLIDFIQYKTIQYIKRRSFSNDVQPYQGALLGFQDVLLPLVKELSQKKLIPSPVYFLLDDADNLSFQQTQILNTWVSYRATEFISLKISTQLNYKTYKTTSGIRIEAPHDYSSIDFTSVHTGSVKERYPKLIEQIVQKRLSKYGIKDPDPYKFFPEDTKQNEAIQKIEQEYINEWEAGNSGAYRGRDDAYRNARPEYIRRLSGISKQGSRYHYAGFTQLVHISSGIIRFFLEPASRMYTEQQLINRDAPVTEISVSVQDQELRKQADQLLLGDFETLASEASKGTDDQLRDIQRLRNLVHGIGAWFKEHILSETASQRRVFSFSISDEPSTKIKEILKLGEIYGYFYKDSIGRKDGRGRTALYVLTRRLAPAFSLDPIGFSGYLTITNKDLEGITENPNAYIQRWRRTGINDSSETANQLSFLDG